MNDDVNILDEIHIHARHRTGMRLTVEEVAQVSEMLQLLAEEVQIADSLRDKSQHDLAALAPRIAALEAVCRAVARYSEHGNADQDWTAIRTAMHRWAQLDGSADALKAVDDEAFQRGRALLRLGAQVAVGEHVKLTFCRGTAEAVSRFLDAACGDAERHWPAGLAVGDGAERPGE